MFARTDDVFDNSIREAMKKIKSAKAALHEDVQPIEGIEEIGAEGKPSTLEDTSETAIMLIDDMKDARETLVEKLNEFMSDDEIMDFSEDLGNIVRDMKNTLDELDDNIQTMEAVFENEVVTEAKKKNVDEVDLEDLAGELEGKYAELPPISSLPRDFLKLFVAKKLDWAFKVYEGKEDDDGDMIFKSYDKDAAKFKAAGWKNYWEDDNDDEQVKIVIFNKTGGTGKVKKTP